MPARGAADAGLAPARRGALRSATAAGFAREALPHEQVAEIQRARLLAATVRTVDELGYSGTTVAHITSCARVSRRTFYELFANREECLVAAIDDLVSRIQAEIALADIARLAWRERVREGLSIVLSFFEREPQLARVCVVQALRGGPAVLERRERILARLAEIVDEGRLESARGAQLTALTAEGLVGAAFTIIHARLLRRERRPLTELLGELVGMIVLPYLGASAARREQARRAPSPEKAAAPARTARFAGDPLEGVPMRLTYRTARVLASVVEHPRASNRTIAQSAGIADQGQVSKLLARLCRLGLVANVGEGRHKGEPNAWVLTAIGEQVAQSVHMHTPDERRAA